MLLLLLLLASESNRIPSSELEFKFESKTKAKSVPESHFRAAEEANSSAKSCLFAL